MLSVGSFVIDLAPPFVKSTVIALFGTGDKPFLVVVLVTLVLLLGAAGGLLQWRRPPFGLLVPLLTGGIAAVAAVTREGATPLSAVPSLAGALVGALLLGSLVRRWRDEEGADASRRALFRAGFWAVAGAAGGVVARSFGSAARRVDEAIATAVLPSAPAAPPPPVGTRLEVPGLTPLITPNRDFYRIDIALLPPELLPEDWSLEVTGDVERPFRLTWAELVALPFAETRTTLACVSNPVGGDLVGTATWLGTPIRDLLARARPRASADMVLSSGADGFSASTPLSVLTDARDAVLAVGMNGAPLPQLHGFPVRMVVPGLYGYVSATKWLTRLEVTRFDAQAAYWTTRGYSARAPVKLSSRIDVPTAGAPPGPVVVAGVAWAQHTGIARVQLQVDDGPWKDCELAEDLSIDVWRQWRTTWVATSGQHRLRVRATDRDGLVQTARITSEAPNGATGLHTVQISVA